MALFAGVMSGTSLDGIDVVLAEIDVADNDPARPHWAVRLVTSSYVAYPAALRARLQHVRHGNPVPIAEISRLHYELGSLYADAAVQTAANTNIALTDIAALGLHGQTVWHAPPSSRAATPATLQLGQPAILAERLQVPIVSDFRARDIAAGGEGAPLVPFADYILLSSQTEIRLMLNIGGIANVTYMPADGALKDILAFDTGPGNLVIDGVISALTEAVYDAEGALAAQGKPDKPLLTHLLAHPYFAQPPPKSTGAELFNDAYITDIRHRGAALSAADLAATVTQLTVDTIARALHDFLPCLPERIIVGGGGARNRVIMAGLQAALPGIPFVTHEAFGIPSDGKEALAFAILAAAHHHRIPANVPSATGARGRRLLGSVTLP